MFIEHEPPKAIQAPSGAAWFELSAWLHKGLLTFISMPLLTELVSIKDGFSYKLAAPDGTFPRRRTARRTGVRMPALQPCRFRWSYSSSTGLNT
jgi:hypothetical protein